jgi:APA family basic amino acid/polyamine antiporter
MGKRKLNRNLGFFDVLMFGVGGIIGAGIYAIIGKAAGPSGNMLWLSFVISSIIALLTGVSYAEFVSRFPDAGGSYEYIKQGLGPKVALFMSIFMAFTGIVAAAAIAISFGDYLGRLITWNSSLMVILIIVLMAIFNTFGSKYSSYYNTFATLVTLLGLFFVIAVSFPEWEVAPLLAPNEGGMMGVLGGAALIFFSYVGFEDLVKLAEETKDARKNVPRAILWSALIVLVCYVLIAISAISVLGAQELSGAQGPLSSVVESRTGAVGAHILTIVALFATSKTILSNIMGTSRLVYDVARDSEVSWLQRFARLSKKWNAPVLAILAITFLTILFGLIGNLAIVASISNIFIFIVFGMVNMALIKLRLKLKKKEKDRPWFYAPLNIKGVSVITVLALVSIMVLFGFNIHNLFFGTGM